jgi:hypothetical protein
MARRSWHEQGVEIEEHFCPVADSAHPPSQSCFRWCHKKLCPNPPRRTRRRTTRSAMCSERVLSEKSWSRRLFYIHLNRRPVLTDYPARHMARPTRPTYPRRAPPHWLSYVTRLPRIPSSLTSEPGGFCRVVVAGRHSRGRVEGHPEEEGQGE